MHVIPMLGRLKQEDCHEVSTGYRVRSCLKTEKKKGIYSSTAIATCLTKLNKASSQV